VVKERIQADARDVIARDRVARGLVTPEMNKMGDRLEDRWNITLRDVHHWPAHPQQGVEYWAPPGFEDQAPAPPCLYRRFSLAQVRITVDRDGALVSSEIVRSSGSRRWDREALDLIERTAPFSPPAARDLDQYGHSRSTWDIGARDYSLSNCVYLGGKFLVKDIVLIKGE
jgi:TonB family protein